MHIDLLRVRLDVRDPGDRHPGADRRRRRARASRRAGCSSTSLRELTIEALPNDIPDSLQHDVSEMEIGDTLTLEALSAPASVELLDDPETVIATLSPPRLQAEEEDEIEEETEVVGEGEGPRPRPTSGRGRATARRRRRVGPDADSRVAAARPVDWLIVGLGNPGAEYERTRHNVGFEIAERLIDALGAAQAEVPLPGPAHRGPDRRPGEPAGRGADAADVHERRRRSRSARRAARSGSTLDHVLVLHDEIDLPFGEIRVRARRRAGRPQRPEVDQGGARLGRFRPRPGRRRPAADDRSRPRRGLRAGPVPRAADEVAGAGRPGRRRGRAGGARRLSVDERVGRLPRLGVEPPRCSLPPRQRRRRSADRRARPRRRRARSSRCRCAPYLIARCWTATRDGRRSSSPATTAPRAISPPGCAAGSRRARSATTRAAASPTSRIWRRRRTWSGCGSRRSTRCSTRTATTARRWWSSARSRCRRRCPTRRCARTGSRCARAS